MILTENEMHNMCSQWSWMQIFYADGSEMHAFLQALISPYLFWKNPSSKIESKFGYGK